MSTIGAYVHSFVLTVVGVTMLVAPARGDTVVKGAVVGSDGESLVGAVVRVTPNVDAATGGSEQLITGDAFEVRLTTDPGSVVCTATAAGHDAVKVVRPVTAGMASCGRMKPRPWVTVSTPTVAAINASKLVQVQVVLQSAADAPQVTVNSVELEIPIPPLGNRQCSGADREIRSRLTAIVQTSTTEISATAVLEVGTPDTDAAVVGRARLSPCESGAIILQIPLTFAVPGQGSTFRYTLTFPDTLSLLGVLVPVPTTTLTLGLCSDDACASGQLRFRGERRVAMAASNIPLASRVQASP